MVDLSSVITIAEYAGSALAIIGAELVSSKRKEAQWGWAFWLISNVLIAVVGLASGHYGVMIMQCWFLKTSYQGIRNHLTPHLRFLKTREADN